MKGNYTSFLLLDSVHCEIFPLVYCGIYSRGLGASFLWGRTKGTGSIQPEEEKAEGILFMPVNI